MSRLFSVKFPSGCSQLLNDPRCTQFEKLISLEGDGLVVNHPPRSNFRTLGVQEDACVTVRSTLQCLLNSSHLSIVLSMVSMGKVQPCNTQALVN